MFCVQFVHSLRSILPDYITVRVYFLGLIIPIHVTPFSPMQAASFLATLLAIFPFRPGFASPRGTARDNIEVASRSASAITPEISALAESLVTNSHVPGINVGVVRLNGSSVVTEYGSWGNRTEDGDLADSRVNYGAMFSYFLDVSDPACPR